MARHRLANMATMIITHMNARPTDTMGRIGSQAEYSLAPDLGSTAIMAAKAGTVSGMVGVAVKVGVVVKATEVVAVGTAKATEAAMVIVVEATREAEDIAVAEATEAVMVTAVAADSMAEEAAATGAVEVAVPTAAVDSMVVEVPMAVGAGRSYGCRPRC